MTLAEDVVTTITSLVATVHKTYLVFVQQVLEILPDDITTNIWFATLNQIIMNKATLEENLDYQMNQYCN